MNFAISIFTSEFSVKQSFEFSFKISDFFNFISFQFSLKNLAYILANVAKSRLIESSEMKFGMNFAIFIFISEFGFGIIPD